MSFSPSIFSDPRPPESIGGLTLDEAKAAVSAWRALAQPSRYLPAAKIYPSPVTPPWEPRTPAEIARKKTLAMPRAYRAASSVGLEWTVRANGREFQIDNISEIAELISSGVDVVVIHRDAVRQGQAQLKGGR